MRTSSCSLTSGKVVPVLVLEETDFPLSRDGVVAKARENQATLFEGEEEIFFIRWPGSNTDRETTEGNLRLGVQELNVQAVTGKASCGCVHHAEEDEACEHDLALIPA